MVVKENQSDNPFEHGRRFILYILVLINLKLLIIFYRYSCTQHYAYKTSININTVNL